MKLPLFDFQEEAKKALLKKIQAAHTMHVLTESSQIITFSAPTGAGKTLVMTSFFEDILLGTDSFTAQPDAIFVWLSDMPDLNEQSRLKIESKSDRIQIRQLLTIDSDYDSEYLEAGNIYFLNTQKLGSEKLLTHKSDTRQYTIWETLTNTALAYPQRLYVVIDEAHRGMNRGSRTENIAHSIMQKFILGSKADGLCVMPLIIGITATPQRFQSMIAQSEATKHQVSVKVEDVKESGLLKDRVILHYPEMAINAEMTMFHSAVTYWKSMSEAWENYHVQEHERLIKPILVVQVDDRTDNLSTRTDIETCLELLESELGRKLEEGEVVHTFNGEGTLTTFRVLIKQVEPQRIEEDEKILMVFFKMNLSTGWDCPRAEIMMSFRPAQDYTYIAQLLGRMVRTPLAHRISANAELNSVHLFLPFFDQSTVQNVIKYLSEDNDTLATETGTERELTTLLRNPLFEDIFDHMQDLVTYKIDGIRQQSNLRRLDKLSVYLMSEAVDIDARKRVRELMAARVGLEIERIKASSDYNSLIYNITGIRLQTLSLNLLTNDIIAEGTETYTVSRIDIEAQYSTAVHTIGDYICGHYRQKHRTRDATDVKLELIVVASDTAAMDNLEDYAGTLFDAEYNRFRREIGQLSAIKREDINRLVASGTTPTPLQWRAPMSIDFKCSENAIEYEKHLFSDNNGRCRVDLNNWEREIITEELSRNDFIAWMRNLDRKNWSVEIPYKSAGIVKSMFPDLLIVRQDQHGYIFDILEPHDSSRSDNYPKAKGLAEFAQQHSAAYGRIQLIRKYRGADTLEHYYRLDLTDIAVLRQVLAINSNEELDRIFESSAFSGN